MVASKDSTVVMLSVQRLVTLSQNGCPQLNPVLKEGWRDSSPKNENSVINYPSSCRWKVRFFQSTKHCWSFTRKRCCSNPPSSWSGFVSHHRPVCAPILTAAGYSEQWGYMVSTMFFKTAWHVKASGHLEYFGQAVDFIIIVLLCFLFLLFSVENWSPCTSVVWEISETLFFL